MNLTTISTTSALGQILAEPVRSADGRPILPAGRTLTAADVGAAIQAEHASLVIAELTADEMSERCAVELVARKAFRGPLSTQAAPAGRLNVTASAAGCLLVRQAPLMAINGSQAVSIATLAHLSYIPAGAIVATVQAVPFAVNRAPVSQLTATLEAHPPALEFLPITQPRVAVIYADPAGGESAARQFGPIMQKRFARCGVSRLESLRARESAISPALRAMLQARTSLIVVASASAPQWDGGLIARQVGEVIGRPPQFHLMPVDPGKVMMIVHAHAAAIVCAPGAYRQGNATSFGLILPALLAGHPISAGDIARLGEGGLLYR